MMVYTILTLIFIGRIQYHVTRNTVFAKLGSISPQEKNASMPIVKVTNSKNLVKLQILHSCSKKRRIYDMKNEMIVK